MPDTGATAAELTQRRFSTVAGGPLAGAVAGARPTPRKCRRGTPANGGRFVREYDSQGDHRTGSAVDAESGRWLADRADDAGLAPEIEWMGFSRIDIQAAYVEVGDRRAEGVPLFDGGFTDAAGVTGTLSSLDGDGAIGLGHVGPRAGSDFRSHRRDTRSRRCDRDGRSGNGSEGLALLNHPTSRIRSCPPCCSSEPTRAWLADAAATGATARASPK